MIGPRARRLRRSRSWSSDGASGPAPAKDSGPAALGRRVADLDRRLACPIPDLRPAIPEDEDPVSGQRIIPPDVLPSLLGRMEGLAVQFHAEAELLVQVVEKLALGTAENQDLALGGGQAMRALDVPHVAMLQRREHAVSDVGQGEGELGAPSNLAPGLDRLHPQRRPGQRALARAAGPAEPAI